MRVLCLTFALAICRRNMSRRKRAYRIVVRRPPCLKLALSDISLQCNDLAFGAKQNSRVWFTRASL